MRTIEIPAVARLAGRAVLLSVLLAACLGSFSGAAGAAPTGAQDASRPLTPAEKAEVARGAKQILGLDAAQVELILNDPELARQVPVGFEKSAEVASASIPQSIGPAPTEGRSLAQAQQCRRKIYNLTFIDVDDRDIYKFSATKHWCFNGQRVTSGSMGPATTWIRADARYSPDEPDPQGFAYNPDREYATQGFVRDNGSDWGAHKSTRAGVFIYYPPGSDRPVPADPAGISQIGRYNGGCTSRHYNPESPTVDSGPSGPHGSTKATFTFSSIYRPVAYQCSLDGGTYAPCSTPKTYSNLAEGPHAFRLRASQGEGNVGNALPLAPVRRFSVDTSSPRVVGLTPPASAVGVPAGTNVAAEFSKGMAETSFFGNFTLEEAASGTQVEAFLFYDRETKVATLDPYDDLRPGLRYEATLRGGEDGVTDGIGNPMQTDKVWGFSVAR